jgi:hypothetical protein
MDASKINLKDIPDPPGYGFRKEREESSVASRNESSSKGILEKVRPIEYFNVHAL